MREFRNPDAALDPRRIDAITDATTPNASGRPHMTASTGPDRTTATTDKLASTSSPTSPSRSGDLALQRPGGAMRSWTYLTLAATCAILVPLTVFAIAQLTNDGPVRVLLTWVIALLMGSAVYASAAATDTARRRR
jgi:hypothetical protein